MSYTISTDIFCDHIMPDNRKCGQWVHGETGPTSRKWAAERNAEKEGWKQAWRYGRKIHICPKHVPDKAVLNKEEK